MEELTSYKLACAVSQILDEKQAKDIVILNISNVSTMADYFVICSADVTTHVKALTSNVREQIKDSFGRSPAGEETDPKNRWNLLDYGDVIVHILHSEERQFYAIEKFWSHACTISDEVWKKENV